jgi:hypothetical protein
MDTTKLRENLVNLIAFFIFFPTISPFINILGDDIGFEEKTRMPYMLCWGGSPRYQRAMHNCKKLNFNAFSRSFIYEDTSKYSYFCVIAELV